MKAKLHPGLALVLSLLLTGCETENICQSHFVITNLNGDGRPVTSTNVFLGRYGGVYDGKTMAALSLGSSSNSLVLFYPTNQLNQIAEWTVDSPCAKAWLVRTQISKLPFPPCKGPSGLALPDSEFLRGTIKAGNFDWRHKNRNYWAVNLAGKNNLAITGEVNFFEKTRFDAKQLWLDPYLIIVGPFVKW